MTLARDHLTVSTFGLVDLFSRVKLLNVTLPRPAYGCEFAFFFLYKFDITAIEYPEQ